MVCNSAVRLTPLIDGKVHHFEARGTYHGQTMMADRETGSFWDIISGECLHGPLAGQRLAMKPLLHMSAGQALAVFPQAEVALSALSLRDRALAFVLKQVNRRGMMPGYFKPTLGREDRRLPRMEIGLGVWGGTAARYYPLKRLREAGRALVDSLEGRTVLVYIEPASKVPAALYSEATSARWQGSELHLDSGAVIRGGGLYDGQGEPQAIEWPDQLFTRWYNFADNFPNCELFGE